MGPPLRCFLDNRIVAGGPFPRVPKVGLCQWWFNSGAKIGDAEKHIFQVIASKIAHFPNRSKAKLGIQLADLAFLGNQIDDRAKTGTTSWKMCFFVLLDRSFEDPRQLQAADRRRRGPRRLQAAGRPLERKRTPVRSHRGSFHVTHRSFVTSASGSSYTMPWAIMALATFSKPAMLAPMT